LFGLFIGCNDVETPLPQAIKLAILPLDVPSENSGERSLGISLADQISSKLAYFKPISVRSATEIRELNNSKLDLKKASSY